MPLKLAGILLLFVGLLPRARGDEPVPKSAATPAEQYQVIAKEFNGEGYALRQANTDEERNEIVARVEKLSLRLLELAEKNPKDPVAMEALVQTVTQEIWMENNTMYPGWGRNSPEVRAIANLLHDYAESDKSAEACRRMSYGFRQECETFLRKVLEVNPHRDVRALASLRLAQFLNGRLQRLDLLKERPELARRYEGLFGKKYIEELKQQDRAQAVKEVETAFEHAAAKEYEDVQLPYGGTVGEKANSELHEIRHLAVGREAQEIEGDDQEDRHFKLSDYRGKVVLLYFWSEY